MAPRRSPSTAATLYRLTDLTCLREAIKRKYLENTDQFSTLDCSVAERTAIEGTAVAAHEMSDEQVTGAPRPVDALGTAATQG